jgi:hypothetical protein
MADMDVLKVLADLRLYKSQLDEVIASLDRLARQRGEKRGRPLKVPTAAMGPVAVNRRKRKNARAKLKSA